MMVRSFKYAIRGIVYCFTTQLNFRIHFLFAILVTAAGFITAIDNYEWTILLICIAMVLTLEMINTAIEKCCDVVHPGFHPAIKILKDVAAGAVLVSAVISAVIGAIIFLPKIIILLKSL